MICRSKSLPDWKGGGTLMEAKNGGNLRAWKVWKGRRRIQHMRARMRMHDEHYHFAFQSFQSFRFI
jgi:hypothetical protein